MPSPTIGCASPAALPTRNTPSPAPRRTPGRIGPLASHGPSRVAGERRARRRRTRGAASLDGVAGALAGLRARTCAEAIGADAAGQRRDAVVGDDHAAVAAGERQHRQQVGRDRRAAEVGLEGEQVAGLRASRRAGRSDGSGSHEPCAATTRPALSSRSPTRPADRPHAQHECARPRRRSPAARTAAARHAPAASAVGEQGVEVLAAERAAIAVRDDVGGRQTGDEVSRAAHQRDAAQLRAGSARTRRRRRAHPATAGCSRRCIRRRPCGAETTAARPAPPTSRRARAGWPCSRRPGRRRRRRRRSARSWRAPARAAHGAEAMREQAVVVLVEAPRRRRAPARQRRARRR